jgi:hypothetical protein
MERASNNFLFWVSDRSFEVRNAARKQENPHAWERFATPQATAKPNP